jgi:hypothetical protein
VCTAPTRKKLQPPSLAAMLSMSIASRISGRDGSYDRSRHWATSVVVTHLCAHKKKSKREHVGLAVEGKRGGAGPSGAG